MSNRPTVAQREEVFKFELFEKYTAGLFAEKKVKKPKRRKE